MNGSRIDVTEDNTDQPTHNFGKSVLIVEDDSLQAYVFERMLTFLGCKVIGKSRSGEEAIDLAIKLKPDVLLIDITLAGEIDGISAVVKAQQKIKVLVIYVTGNEKEFFLKKAQNSEFIDFISKPVTMNLLIEAFKKLDS